jgi:hypothetical protein
MKEKIVITSICFQVLLEKELNLCISRRMLTINIWAAMCVVFEAMVVKNVELFPLNTGGNFFILRFPFPILIFPVR